MEEIEALITRAEAALCYAEPDDVVEALIASGVEAGQAYLAVIAATIHVQIPE